MKRSVALGIAVLAGLCVLAPHYHAAAQPPSSPGVPAPDVSAADDPPGRVARISYLSGTVSFKAAGTDEWVMATLNRPVTVGDELWTAQGSRAELDLGHAFIRMDGTTDLGLLNQTDRFTQIKLTDGTAAIHLRRLEDDDEFEVDAPDGSFTLLRTGDYRFGVSDNDTVAIARSGQMEAATSGQTFTIRPNQQARLTASAAPGDVTAAGPLDGFDTFCQTRDRRGENSESAQHVSPYVIGREDLDENGAWQTYPDYGSVWVPRNVPVDWAPYRYGHWVWVAPWGWTWVDDAPWGFAPFHYGRWVSVNARWAWVPGPVRVRAVYAPALVVFVGGGPGLRYHVDIGAGGGLGVAWFPLGPREVYIPPYRASRVYVTNVNISHTVIVNQTNIWNVDVTRQRYVNRTVVTAVAERDFVEARSVNRVAVRLNANQVRDLRIEGAAAPVAPTARSIARREEGERAAARPTAVVEQRTVTVRRTPAPRTLPIERQRAVLDRDPGRAPDPARVNEIRRSQPAPEPNYRQARPVARPEADRPAAGGTATRPQAAPEAPVQQPTPQQAAARPAGTLTRPAPEATPKQTETRRRDIEREHQRSDKKSKDKEREKKKE